MFIKLENMVDLKLFPAQVSLYTFNYVTSSYADQGIKFYIIAPIHLNDPSTDDIFGEYFSIKISDNSYNLH